MADIEVVFFDIGDTLAVVSTREWVPGAKSALAALASKGLRLGLLSNTGPLTRDQVTDLLPTDFDWSVFEPDLVLLSSEVGHEKPKLPIYLVALARAGVAPDRCCFVGERLEENLAAQRVGMRSMRLGVPASDYAEIPGLL